MRNYVKKKRILLYCNKELEEALKNKIKNVYFKSGEKIKDVVEYKPNVIIFDREAEGVVKYANKKTYLMFLSNDSVFSGILENGFEAKNNTNPINKKGEYQVFCEKLVKDRDNSLIVRLGYVLTKEVLKEIENDIRDKKKIDNQRYIYPMKPDDISHVIDTLISLSPKGLVHLRGSDKTTYFRIAQVIAELLSLEAPDSKYVHGNTTNIKLNGIILPTNIREAVKEYINESR